MWEFVADNWGGLASVIGVPLALISVAFAIWEARRARSASEAATQAAEQVKQELTRYVLIANFERAFALIRHIKSLHQTNGWTEALTQYEFLRSTTIEIAKGFSDNVHNVQPKMRKARLLISDIQSSILGFADYEPAEHDRVRLYRRLTDIQEDLEDLASIGRPGESYGGME